ncbi:MAG: DUF4837 family protein [Bacteroidales bacterium]|jgi:hypothetical protein
MKTKSFLFALTALVVIGLSGCIGKGGQISLPPCTGKPGEVLIIMADDLYKGAAGDTLINLLTQEEPALPQTGMEGAEPMFDVLHLPPAALNNTIRPARNLMIVDVGPHITKPEVNVFKDYWADEQILIRLDAPDRDQLVTLINENRHVILKVLRDGEVDRQVKYDIKYQNQALNEQLFRNHLINISFPKGFAAKVDTGKFAWVQYDPVAETQGVLLWDYPYTSEKQLELPELKAFTDAFLKPRVYGPSAPAKESYMRIVPDLPVTIRTFQLNGVYVRELRGLWEAKIDFMGGPFISWTFVDEKRNRLVTAFGFVYAPKIGKRNPMRKIEGLLKTISFPD